MPNRDTKNSIQVVHLGNLTLSGTTAATSAWVDTRGFDSVTFVVVANTITDAGTASGGFTFDMEEGDTTASASATSVAAGEIIGSLDDLKVTDDNADDTVPGGVGYIGNKRYVRLKATGTTGTNADVSVLAVCAKAAAAPPTFVGTKVAAT